MGELDRLEASCRALGEENRHALSTRRFTQVLTEWLPAQCRAYREEIVRGGAKVRGDALNRLNWLLMVQAEIREQVRQRKDPALLPLLGDADALAEACYRPIFQFTQSSNLPLTTAHPVTRLSEVDIAIWTGFAQTSLAPIFLPRDFFERIAWWPAVAHEIGHDFLISIDGLRDRICAELELPGEKRGSAPLELDPAGFLSPAELWRVHGVWFEELFCDVFGTLMCGPAYGHTMVELFAAQEDPREVLVVAPEGRANRYGVHPPRHLRLHVVAWVLEAAGFSREAKALLASWHKRNRLNPDEGVALLFYTRHGYISLDWTVVEPFTRQIVDRLYRGPIGALRGHGLRDISGLDYGPSLHAQSNRAKTQLLAGQVPAVRDVRAVISGAVLAWLEKPELEEQLLRRARSAIPAVGTFERAPGAFDLPPDPHRAGVMAGPLDLSAQAVSEALILREILQRPGPAGRAGVRPGRSGMQPAPRRAAGAR